MDNKDRAANFLVHCFANIELRTHHSRFDGVDQYGSGSFVGPLEPIFDLLGRMRIGQNVTDEVVGKIRIAREPVVAVILIPALPRLPLCKEMLLTQIWVAWPDARCGTGQHGGFHALGVVCRKNAGEQPTE